MRHSETNQKITTGKVEKYTRKIKQIGEWVGERMNEWMNEWMGGPKSLFNAICEQSRKKKLTYKKTKNTSFVVMGLFSYRLLVNLLKWLSLLLFCSTTPYNRNLYNFWSPLFLLALFKKKKPLSPPENEKWKQESMRNFVRFLSSYPKKLDSVGMTPFLQMVQFPKRTIILFRYFTKCVNIWTNSWAVYILQIFLGYFVCSFFTTF